MRHLSSPEWQDYLSKALPDGSAWALEDNALLAQIAKLLALEINRLDVFISALIDELNPAQAENLLPEWERDALMGNVNKQTITQRQQSLTAQITFHETVTQEFTVNLAKNFGLDIAIDEPKPNKVTIILPANTPVYFICSQSRCGDELLNIQSDTHFETRLQQLAPAHVDISFNYEGV